MKKIKKLNISVEQVTTIDFPNNYQAFIRYQVLDAAYEERIMLTGGDKNSLPKLFNEIAKKVEELEQDHSFGAFKRV